MSYTSNPIDSNFTGRGIFRVRLTATKEIEHMIRAIADNTKYTIARLGDNPDVICIILLDRA